MKKTHFPLLLTFAILASAAGGTSDWVSAPKLDFPKDALQRGSEGSVKLLIVLTKDGRVSNTRVLRSSGDAVLDATAQAGVAKWRMNPAAVKESDLTKGRIQIIEFRQEPIVGARYPDRAAYFESFENLHEFMSAPFPAYPTESRRRRDMGEVVVKAVTGPDGRVTSVELMKSSGHRELDRTAMAAVKLWRVHKQYAGKTYRVPINFTMPGGRRIPNFW